MPPIVWLNGAFLDRDAAKVSVFDAGFQHAVGLFETMLAIDGRAIRVARHIERLRTSARELGLSDSLRPGPLIEAVNEVAEKAALARARIRLTVTGGDLNMLAASGRSPQDPTILIVAQPATEYPREMFDRGVSAVIADARANPLDPFASHKTLNYWPRLRALQIASARAAGEAIFLQVSNHLAGGSVSNIFLVRNGALATPIARAEEEAGGLPSPVLPGITRATIIEIVGDLALACDTRMLSVDELLDAEEVFLTNSSWGVLPIVQVEAKKIGDAKPGPITRRLREKWESSLRQVEPS